MEKDPGYAWAAAHAKPIPLAQATRYVFTKTMEADHIDDTILVLSNFNTEWNRRLS